MSNPVAAPARRRSSHWLLAFLVVGVAHLVLVGCEAAPWDSVTKVLLMPLLAAWVVSMRGPALLVAALLLSTVGDAALEVEDLFLVGMAGFAAAHVCYITLFVRRGVLGRLRHRWYVPVGWLAVWVVVLATLWGPIGSEDPALQLPIAVYSLLLTATAATAGLHGARTGWGGALFLVSDTLIALELADVSRPEPAGVWVMVTYLLGQYLLATGIVATGTGTHLPSDSLPPRRGR